MQLDSAKETITCLRAELQSRGSAAKDLSTGEDTLEDLKQQIQQVRPHYNFRCKASEFDETDV